MKLIKKVKNIIDMKPSNLDYELNVGLEDTELLWRQNLLSNNCFTAPLTQMIIPMVNFLFLPYALHLLIFEFVVI